jgi:hypothetical protein
MLLPVVDYTPRIARTRVAALQLPMLRLRHRASRRSILPRSSSVQSFPGDGANLGIPPKRQSELQVPPGDLFHTKATGAVTLRACAAVGASGQPGGVAVMVAGEYVADQPPREKPRLTEPTHIVRFRTNTVVVRESHAERICR